MSRANPLWDTGWAKRKVWHCLQCFDNDNSADVRTNAGDWFLLDFVSISILENSLGDTDIIDTYLDRHFWLGWCFFLVFFLSEELGFGSPLPHDLLQLTGQTLHIENHKRWGIPVAWRLCARYMCWACLGSVLATIHSLHWMCSYPPFHGQTSVGSGTYGVVQT